jgi:hypothetical protein
MVRKISFLCLFLSLISCKKDNVDGILIGDALLAHQSLSENRELENLIVRSLGPDKSALIKLIDFPNGGGASGYDLGFVITQIIYRIGENNFAEILQEMEWSKRSNIAGLINVGLQYGDNDYDGEMDQTNIENEFPKLHEILSIKD